MFDCIGVISKDYKTEMLITTQKSYFIAWN